MDKMEDDRARSVQYKVSYFRPPLLGTHFIIETDHRNLTYIHGGSSPKMVRWALMQQKFHFVISHIPGETNVMADALCRDPKGVSPGIWAIQLEDFDADWHSEETYRVFRQLHNDVLGHRGLHATTAAAENHYESALTPYTSDLKA